MCGVRGMTDRTVSLSATTRGCQMRLVELRYLPRKARNAVRIWILWNRQGKPTDGPVVIHRGDLLEGPDGQRGINNWAWDFRYMQGGPIPYGDLWDFLSARYPVERKP